MSIYTLKYKNDNVLTFNVMNKSVKLHNRELLPISIRNMDTSYDMINVFCSSRVMMMNREYCKEILIACNIDNQDYVNICIFSKGLSFRDNYWISKENSNDTWETVNLYNNKFSNEIANVCITGDIEYVNNIVIDDSLFTGELTNKGTRAKCFKRNYNNLYLIKNETITEISSEILSWYIANAIGIKSSKYSYIKYLDKHCSVCKIETSESKELIPCRDVMSYFNDIKLSTECNTYKLFIESDCFNFIRMQLFDYLTLNVDRNRDNYGLLRENCRIVGLYPIFDHDSCFKGKSIFANYFPTGVSFRETLKYLKYNYRNIIELLKPELINSYKYFCSKEFTEIFLKYKTQKEYNLFISRMFDIIND